MTIPVGESITVLGIGIEPVFYTTVDDPKWGADADVFMTRDCGTFDGADEGITWIRGLHKEDSEAVKALRAAFALVNGERE